jgi:hypothetical protein
MKRAIVAIALLLGSAPTMAQQTPILLGQGGVRGGCGEWARANEYENHIYDAWVLGYISAANKLAVTNITGDISNASVLDWAKLWCRNHPLDQIASAAQAVITELSQRLAPSTDQLIPTRRR